MIKRKIEVLAYEPAWRAIFAEERAILTQAMGENALFIEHIGSTSVPGLVAKPVIDILVAVNSLERLDTSNKVIEACGYQAKGENGIVGRRYFQKGGDLRTHHVHAFKNGDPQLLSHRTFRDYLIANPAIAAEYGRVKQRAAQACNNDIISYMALKNDFIQHHQQLALAWYDDKFK